MADNLEHFRQVLVESCVRIFCEPFGRQALSSEAEGGFASNGNPCAKKQVRHVGHAGDAVAKRESRARVQHEEFEGGKREMVILSSAHLRPRYRSRPWTKAAIFRSATERLSIQKPQSGCAKRTRPGPRTCSARSRARAISSGVST